MTQLRRVLLGILSAPIAAAIAGRTAGGATVSFAVALGLALAIVALTLRTLNDLQRRLAEQAMTDPLTGAFNRRHLEAALTLAIERRNRMSEPASLLLIDIDHFKAVNDAFGHAAGDAVLTGLADLLGRRMRTLDVLFRIGGEEFALLLCGARYPDALLLAEDLRLMVQDSPLLDGGRVSVSIGVSGLQAGQSAYGWIADADRALYRAKHAGRNRVAGRAATNGHAVPDSAQVLPSELWRSRKVRSM